MLDPELTNKVVLITGANHGIGAATSRAFALQGAAVFIAYYRLPTSIPPERLAKAKAAGAGGPELYAARQLQDVEPLLGELHRLGARAAAWESDLGEAANIPILFERCEAELGPVDVLVCNHTHCMMETFDPARVRAAGFPVSLVSAAEIDRHFTVNARAVALLMAEYFQRYLQRGASMGRVINLSTDAASSHEINVSYAASKHAIESYSRSAACEMGRYGITVNVIAPGPVQTGYITPEQEAAIASSTPLRRVGRPEDIADAIVFLASAQARWLTGQLLYVGGGWRMPQ